MAGENPHIDGIDQFIKNMSSYEDKVVVAIANGAQKTQAAVVNHARATHGAGAHGIGRFETQTETLINSIQPGGVTIEDDSVEALIEARAEYAGYVEGDPQWKTTSRGVYPFLGPALKDNQRTFTENILTEVKKVKP